MLRNMLAKKNLREIILKIFSYSLGFLATQDKPHKKSGCKNDLKSRDLKKIGAEAQEDFRRLTQQVCADSFLAKLRPVSQIHRPLFREGCSKNGPKMMFFAVAASVVRAAFKHVYISAPSRQYCHIAILLYVLIK